MFFLSYLCLFGYYTLYSHFLLFSYAVFFCCVFLLCFSAVFFCCVSLLFFSLRYVLALSFVVDAVFFADLPILLPSVGLSSLLCVIIRLGVFRGSEAKKNRFRVVVGWYIYGKRADETFVCPIRPMSLAGYFLCRNDVVLLCGLSVLTFPVTVGVMLS